MLPLLEFIFSGKSLRTSIPVLSRHLRALAIPTFSCYHTLTLSPLALFQRSLHRCSPSLGAPPLALPPLFPSHRLPLFLVPSTLLFPRSSLSIAVPSTSKFPLSRILSYRPLSSSSSRSLEVLAPAKVFSFLFLFSPSSEAFLLSIFPSSAFFNSWIFGGFYFWVRLLQLSKSIFSDPVLPKILRSVSTSEYVLTPNTPPSLY